jgi:hypothetical protein
LKLGIRRGTCECTKYIYRPLEGQGSSSSEGYTVQGEECVGGREREKQEGKERGMRWEGGEGWRETVPNRKIGENGRKKKETREKRRETGEKEMGFKRTKGGGLV